MLKFSNINEYVALYPQHKDGLQLLVDILEETPMEQTIKWKLPVYTINGKNVVGLGAFKNHFSLWFFHGNLLTDEAHLLENAQEGKTHGMRHMKFECREDIKLDEVAHYIQQAIENEQSGRTKLNKPPKTKKPARGLEMSEALVNALNKNDLKGKFKSLSPSKQREYKEYISTAKRASTVTSRLSKILPMIKEGMGLNDRYR